ncbi:MAG: hypothetical protein K1X74_10440 [Pirellulales bacterium]|nr:hypothetical protein [Pirellulales bacterium]
MSIGATGFLGSLGGVPVTQGRATDVERSRQDRANQERQVASGDKAEAAAGIGTTDEDRATQDRDADGRRLWEESPENRHDAAKEAGEQKEGTGEPTPRPARDITGNSGTLIDLAG